jgi:hypothetical protein
MLEGLKDFVANAYPRRDAPLLRGHRAYSVRLSLPETVEVRYLRPRVRRLTVGPVSERLRRLIGELH